MQILHAFVNNIILKSKGGGDPYSMGGGPFFAMKNGPRGPFTMGVHFSSHTGIKGSCVEA